ncbi:MAG: hypothetical protein K2G73_01420 [Eubacterium sp.]|nr:hypothetical protein [Eubacterium sp.]
MNLKRFRKRTAYNAEKQNKATNFAHLNKHYCKKGQTVIAGDSITEICNMELYREYEKRNSLDVYNRGISGDTSDRLLERLQSNVLCLMPKNVVYLIGTNDISIGADEEYVFSNIEEIIIKTCDSCPDTNIILLKVFPVNGKNNRFVKKKNSVISRLNDKLDIFEKRYGITVLDLTNELSDNNGMFNSKYTYDGLHPNVFGYEVEIAEIIKLLEK